MAISVSLLPGYKKTALDHILVQGLLNSGAVASLAFRRSWGTTNQNCLRWLISGSKGEISVTIPKAKIQSGAAGRKLQLRKGNGVVEDVDFEFDKPEHVKSIAIPGTNVVRIYGNFATGHKAGHSDFEGALESQLSSAIEVHLRPLTDLRAEMRKLPSATLTTSSIGVQHSRTTRLPATFKSGYS